ncbi:MAG: hypothetical protein U5Q03_06670 [Bacteroidota bacterium]|nr:hypothetical protein [Bacteroidota bacterium]
MKKVLIVVAAVFLLAVMASSCKSVDKCPAYGEHYKYQIDNKY